MMTINTPENLIVLSDLHINEGWLEDEGKYSPREDFFYARPFFDLLRHYEELRSTPPHTGSPWQLILNGDTFDFEQVMDLPSAGAELEAVCGVTTYAELGERARFGLGTSEPEGCWRIRRIARGHPLFFAALGWFVAHGNRILMLKGNHDAELYWPGVQETLRREVLEAYRRYRRQHPDAPPLEESGVAERIEFEPWFYYDSRYHIYVEHGNQYEPTNRYADPLCPVEPGDANTLALPQGMLFTRYVLNRLEEDFPYTDNVRPITRALPWMLSEDPLGGTRILLTHVHDLLTGWRYLVRGDREKQPLRSSMTSSRGYGGLPAPLVGAIQATAQKHGHLSWGIWAPMVLSQALAGILRVGAVGLAARGLFCLLAAQRCRSTGSFLGALAMFNAGHFWTNHINDDRQLNYLPTIASEIAESFKRATCPLSAIIAGHTHIPYCQPVEGRQTWLLNTGAWMPTLIRKPHHWTIRLTFACITPNSEPRTWFREWDPRLGRPVHPNLSDDGYLVSAVRWIPDPRRGRLHGR